MADLRDFTGKNRKFTGTIGERISTGTTGERDDATFGAGTLRFNTTTALMEYYTGTEWKSIDAPPTITSFALNGGSNVTSANIASDSSIYTIAINGSLFDTTSGTILFEGTGGGDVSPLTTTRNSSSLFTITVNSNSFNATYEPYDIKITNGSGLSATLENCINSDAKPNFTTAAGTLGTILNGALSSYSLSTAAATDADGNTITYSIVSGSLPPGLSLNSSTAAITGTATAVVTDTTSTFTVRASTTVDGGVTTFNERQFSITVQAPVVVSYTSGSGNFSVPSGVTAVDVLVVAGGGAGGQGIPNNVSVGAGGAGGLIFRPGFTVTPGGSIPYSVGGGGVGAPSNAHTNGTDTTFGTLTAVGGGKGGVWDGQPGVSGGSGGGGSSGQEGGSPGGSATQPSQPGDSGTYGFGNSGGTGGPTWSNGNPGGPNTRGGGGGGAGGAGTPGNQSGAGGAGLSYSISGSSVSYAGGGGGGAGQSPGPAQAGGGAGGSPGQSPAPSGTANRGGGGGGGGVIGQTPDTVGGSGGSGVVIIKY
jgi:hypothetical protein